MQTLKSESKKKKKKPNDYYREIITVSMHKGSLSLKHATLLKSLNLLQTILTSSRGLSVSSSGTVVVAVALSLAVAADAGDMVITTTQRPVVHGSPDGMLSKSRVRHKHAANSSAHHPQETSAAGTQTEGLKGCCIPSLFQVGTLRMV